MALSVYYSDKIEDLAADLKERLLAERCKADADPFVFSQVVVPNTNIAKWLQIRVFAEERNPEDRKLCAGIKFPFVEQRMTELLSANLPEKTPFSLLPDHAYANAIMAALLSPRKGQKEFDALAPLRAYISGGDGKGELKVTTQCQARMGWQLAEKMANLMDQYEVRRPEIVEKWLAEEGDGAAGVRALPEAMNEVEAAEAALARMLWGMDGVFPLGGEKLSLRQLYDRVKSTPPKGPRQTIWFFGHSTLSLLQVQILVWLAQTHDVVFYHNNVCLEYWGDIETKEERIKRLGKAHAEKDDISVENLLLRQWGAAGRETMRLLVQLEEENDGRIDFEWECLADPNRTRPTTVLGKVQESICHRTSVSDKVPQDASLQVVGVPGIRREVEMVYNAIIGAVWKPEKSGDRPWSDCNFSDIAVLVPDMAKYRPVIEAVFDARGEVPFGLIDTTASEDSAFLAGFFALADLARRGLTRETLFAVLDNPCVQKALGFTSDDVADWRETTEAIGAFDGFENGNGGSKFGWDWALSRLRLARVADRLPVIGEKDEELPLVGRGDNNAFKLSEIVELLYRKVEAAFDGKGGRRVLPCATEHDSGDAKWVLNWSFVLTKLMDDFLAVPDKNVLEATVKNQIVKVLKGLEMLPGKQDSEVVLAAVEQFVGGISCRRGGYLTHGVTIAGLQPMRPVPFKQVFVLGLGANGFPGRTSSTTLDVRGAGWRLGDTSVPKVNRYLFLETVMSARDRLVLSYQNLDIEKDAKMFPAGIVRELENFVGDAIIEKPFEEFEKFPLLERGEKNAPPCDVSWDPKDPQAGILPTYSKVARQMACERMGVDEARRAHASDDAAREDTRPPVGAREVSAKELAEFLKSPLHAVLRYQHHIAEEGYSDNELEIDSPLGVSDSRIKWALEESCLDGEEELDAQFRRMQLAGQLPGGFLGDFAKGKFAETLKDLDAIRKFMEDFGVTKGQDHTSRQRVSATVKHGNAPVKVQYVAETSNWSESDGRVSVLVSGWLLAQGGNDLPPDARPVDNTLAPFMAFLMSLAHAADADAETPHFLRVGVIDIANGKVAAWNWSVTPKNAREYLDRLTTQYWAFLDGVDRLSPCVDFTYKKLAKAIRELESRGWPAVLESLTAEEWDGNSKQKSFNKDLVVEKAADAYRRDPTTTEELEKLYEDRYKLPMSGQKESDGKGGAQ